MPTEATSRKKMKSPPELPEFLRNNPWSKVEGANPNRVVLLPWNDSSIVLDIGGEDPASVGLLNSVILPERFNAVYHQSRRCLEFIFNAVFDNDEPNPSEPFEFVYRGNVLKCSYGAPSPELMFLAHAFKPTHSNVDSDFRNLSDLQLLQQSSEFPKKRRVYWESVRPISFFVAGIEN